MNDRYKQTLNAKDDVIGVEGLARRFGKKPALDGVTCRVRRGQVHGLVGENGAGKTTLIEHILGGYRPQRGSVSVFGLDPVKRPVAVLERIGYLSEERDIPGWMRVNELIRYSKSFYPAWDDAYAEEMRQHFGLDSQSRVKTLSRGERAKAGLLCAIAYRPELLLLDEPSSGLDVSARRDILETIVRTVADEGRTVVFSSHLLDEVERVADYITMLHRGRVVLDGPLDEIREAHGRALLHYEGEMTDIPELPGQLHAFGRGHERNIIFAGARAPFQEAAIKGGARIIELSTPSLEDIFLARTGTTIRADSAA